MPPQTTIPLAANILGTIGTFFWCFQLIPQIWHNWRNKSTEGLPGLMMFLFALSTPPFGVYTVVQNFNLPVQLQPQVFGVLSLVSWAQTLIYHNGWKTWKATLLALTVGLFFAGVEVGLIFTLRGLYDQGIEYPMVIVGVVASIILAAGLIPPYIEIWKRNGRVVGINWMFLSMDWLGAFLSLMAVVAQTTFDPLGGVLFIIVAALETGIFMLHIIWLLRTRGLRQKAKALGIKFDDLPEARKFKWPRTELPGSDNEAFRSENTLCSTLGGDLEKGTLASNLALSRSDSRGTQLALDTTTFGTFNINAPLDHGLRRSFPLGVLPDDFGQDSDADTLGRSERNASDSDSDTDTIDGGEPYSELGLPKNADKKTEEEVTAGDLHHPLPETTATNQSLDTASEVSRSSSYAVAQQTLNEPERISFPQEVHLQESSRP